MMIYGFETLEIALAFVSLVALIFSFLQIRLRKADAKSFKEMRAHDDAPEDHVELPTAEEAVVTSSTTAIEDMLVAIAAGANVLDEAAKNGFSEDEARVAMASYDI